MDFKCELKNTVEKIEKALAGYMNISDMPQQRVYDAMKYSLLAGGKRLRPVLMLFAYRMCGGKDERIMPFACALEMIHTYSLIHDDLPAMDNDDLRRGMPTNHVKFDEATAILAGDALLNMAFEITSQYSDDDISDRQILKAISVLSGASGASGMIGGQMIDIESEDKNISLKELSHLHSLKTGAIIRAGGVCGAILAGAKEDEIKAVDSFCYNLGIAFQIRDDILDVEGDADILGKPIGSDAENAKNTYVKLTSLEESKKLVAEYTDKALKALDIFGDKAENLTELAKMLVQRNN